MGPAGDMESQNMRVAQASIEIRNMLTARRLPLRAWQLWKPLRGADSTALQEFFETDDHCVRLRNYFWEGRTIRGLLPARRLPRPAW